MTAAEYSHENSRGAARASDPLAVKGQFARSTRLCVKALRLYGEVGVNGLARIDASGGYRFPRTGRLREAERARRLRALDLPPAEARQRPAGFRVDR